MDNKGAKEGVKSGCECIFQSDQHPGGIGTGTVIVTRNGADAMRGEKTRVRRRGKFMINGSHNDLKTFTGGSSYCQEAKCLSGFAN